MFDSVGHAHSRGIGGRHHFFSHYPLDVGGFDKKRLVSLHGHTHGTGPSYAGRLDVGVDSLTGFVPGYEYGAVCLDDLSEAIEGHIDPVQVLPERAARE